MSAETTQPAPSTKTVEAVSLLLNRATQWPIDDCENFAATITGMVTASGGIPAPKPAPSPERELLATFTDWARQVAAREDVPRGIRSAAAGLHDDGKRLLASDPLSRFGFEAVINPSIPAGVIRLYQDGKLVGEINNIKASS